MINNSVIDDISIRLKYLDVEINILLTHEDVKELAKSRQLIKNFVEFFSRYIIELIINIIELELVINIVDSIINIIDLELIIKIVELDLNVRELDLNIIKSDLNAIRYLFNFLRVFN